MFFFFDFGDEENAQLKRKANAGIQVKNGKAFEFAIAKTYANYLEEKGLNVSLEKNSAIQVAQRFYFEFPESVQRKFDNAAYQTIDTMVKIEPKLICQTNSNDILHIMLNEDSDGQSGDVREV
ncbi:MAG: HaeIII family restriction endonuclease, partial [Treponema sp.]|nr:HaeIII family restriction endonuclease [Treponema sp.]